jgi:hypothetical protein
MAKMVDELGVAEATADSAYARHQYAVAYAAALNAAE